MTPPFCTFVFSFNRGVFLENCLNSIESCLAGAKTVIIDDNSTDPETLETLSELSKRFEVIHPQAAETEIKTGGLYANMNYAMDIANSIGSPYALFIQDDMQLVRKIDASDFRRISSYFQEIPNSFQISTSFIRQLSVKDFFKDHFLDLKSGSYIRRRDRERGKSNFSAAGVFDVERFHNIYGSFEIGEGKNSERAQQLGLVCGRSITPFMCWLPYPNSYRGRARNMKHRFFEYFGRSGYYPIELMSDLSTAEFLNRDPMILPVMEHYLLSPSAPRNDIWSTGGGEYNFDCYDGFAARVFRALKRSRRLIRGRGN